MDDLTSINTPERTISSPKDTSITYLEMKTNKKIEFLPKEIYKTFPGLTLISANSCSIKSVSKGNFVNLNTIKYIFLNYNQIVKISDETFSGIASLEELHLRESFILFVRNLTFDDNFQMVTILSL